MRQNGVYKYLSLSTAFAMLPARWYIVVEAALMAHSRKPSSLLRSLSFDLLQSGSSGEALATAPKGEKALESAMDNPCWTARE